LKKLESLLGDKEESLAAALSNINQFAEEKFLEWLSIECETGLVKIGVSVVRKNFF